MFSRLAVASTVAFVALAAAQHCNTGPVQCCNSMESANSAAGSALLTTLGVVLQDTTAQIGLDCSPVTVVGAGTGSACSAHAVCCKNNNVGGLISLGCLPVSL